MIDVLMALVMVSGTANSSLLSSETDVVAAVGSSSVTWSELDRAVKKSISSQFYHRRLPLDKEREVQCKQLKMLIKRKLSVFGAAKKDMQLPMEEAEIKRKQIEDSAGTEGYLVALEQAGISVDEHRRMFAELIQADRAYMRFVTKEAEVSDGEVERLFETEDWVQPEAIKLSHILLKNSKVGGESDSCQQRAIEILAMLEDGDSFGQLAAQHSQDNYRIKKGSLGWVHRGRLMGELEEVVWSADVGVVKGPITSSEGCHIVRIDDRRDASSMTFEAAGPMIRSKLVAEKLKDAESKWFLPLIEDHTIVVNVPFLVDCIPFGDGGESP